MIEKTKVAPIAVNAGRLNPDVFAFVSFFSSFNLAPQLGQKFTSPEISAPHSGHLFLFAILSSFQYQN